MTTEVFASSIGRIEDIYLKKGLTGFRLDLKHAQKTYGKSIHYIPIEMEIEAGKWVPVGETIEMKVIHDPVFSGQKYPGARLSFTNNAFAHTCEVVQEIGSKLIAQMEAQPWMSARVKAMGVRQSFIQVMSKAGSLPMPIVRATLRFRKQGEDIKPTQICDTKIVRVDKTMEPVAYSDVNKVIPAGTIARASIDLSTIVLSSQGLNLRCEVAMMHIKGFEAATREPTHLRADDIIEALQ